MAEHLCVGPTCWVCGEPTELRDMRWAIREDLVGKNSHGLRMSECSALAKIASEAIRGGVLDLLVSIADLQDQLHFVRQELLDLVEHHRTADVEE